MATQVVNIPAGSTSAILAVGPNTSISATPAVLGGTVTVFTGPTPSGPWLAWSAGASASGASTRLATTGYVYAVAATQAATLALADFGAGQGSNPLNEPVVNVQGVCATPSTTSEVGIFSFRIPPLFLKLNFRMAIRATTSFTNNANAKTLQVRMNGLAGTLAFQSPALASNANYAFEADFVGVNDGATLKGLGAGATGGFGLSTTALTTLARDYINNETEIVISATKATGTDTFQMDSLIVNLYQ
jgi:hypothetical protein